MSAGVLALIEVVDRHGVVQLRLPVTQWPVTVGRDLTVDLVLDDVHVAAQHLRLEQIVPGQLDVQVQDSINGATLGNRQHMRGAQFDWLPGQLLSIGRTHLQLRLADSPVAVEQPLPRWHWRAAAWTLAGLAASMLLVVGQSWLKSTETSQFSQTVPTTVLSMLGAFGVWAGLWALITKLFNAQAQFWRHMRIACAMFLLLFWVETGLELLAFMFSWELLVRFENVLSLLVLSTWGYLHLLVVVPKRRRVLAVTMTVLLLLANVTMLGTQWLKNKRLSSQLYMNQLYPPGLRLANPVPVAQFLQEASSIEQRLATRLQDKEGDDGAANNDAAGDE